MVFFFFEYDLVGFAAVPSIIILSLVIHFMVIQKFECEATADKYAACIYISRTLKHQLTYYCMSLQKYSVFSNITVRVYVHGHGEECIVKGEVRTESQ